MIVFYNPPSSANRKPVLPMSLLAVGALLEGAHEYVIVDGNLDPDALGTIDRHIQDGATTLTVTVMPGPQLENAVPICRALRRRNPALTILWGGYFPTQHWEACLADDTVDYVVRGHGERVHRALIEALTAGDDPTAIPGLAYRRDGMPVSNPLAPIPHPADLPDFPYQRLAMERYLRRTFLGSRTLPHHSSYGCPFRCNFCAVVNMVDGAWLAQSAERTAATARRLVADYGVNAVEMYDNNFFTHEARTAEFSARILDLGIGWWGEGRIDTLLKYRDASWRTMKASGLRMVFLGAESGSDATLRRMNKGGTATAEKTIDLAKKMGTLGIVPEFSFVLGNPPDPEQDVADTIAFIRRVKAANPASEIILYHYTPVPLAGELFEEAKANGFAFPTTLDGWISPEWHEFSQRRSARLPWLDDPIQSRVRGFERVLNAYYPTATDRRLTGARRAILRAASGWRYHLGFYRWPIELRALQRVFSYQRPETSGF